MKIYAIYGTEGSPEYVKQSMKLPKSWADKQVKDVLGLFVETYNKKNAGAPLDAEKYHLERPLGTNVFPDELISNALSEYCDVHVVEGVVKSVMTGKAAERAAGTHGCPRTWRFFSFHSSSSITPSSRSFLSSRSSLALSLSSARTSAMVVASRCFCALKGATEARCETHCGEHKL